MHDQAIRVRSLRKSYGEIEAVRGIDLDITRGEVFALLGPNGAGKTTTVEVLEGYRDRTSGEVSVLGHDPADGDRRFRERIGIVLQETAADPYLTVTEALDMYRGYYPRSRAVGDILALVGLEEQATQRVRRLSGGQRRRLDVALGLAGDPELLFLDEPTTGFDPSARREAWDMVRGLRELGTTVLLTTHYMDEAQQLADRVAIIARGVLVAEGSPHELMARDHTTTIEFRRSAEAGPLPPGIPVDLDADGERVVVRTLEPTPVLHALTAWALEHGRALEELRVTQPSLEEVYLELTATAETAGTNGGAR